MEKASTVICWFTPQVHTIVGAEQTRNSKQVSHVLLELPPSTASQDLHGQEAGGRSQGWELIDS